MSLRALSVLLLGAACQFPQTSESGFSSDVALTTGSSGELEGSSGPAGPGDSNASSEGGDGSAEGAEESAEGPDQPVLDVGNTADIGDGTPAGCAGKIDFLFVISREGVMRDLQSRLVEALPKFIATIQGGFADFDYHIMVVDSDETWGLEECAEECADSGSCAAVEDYPCGHLKAVGQCDQMLGAGNVFSAGYSAYNKPCTIAGGKRFLTREQHDLPESFKCIAQVGSGGRGRIGDALAAAVSTQLGGIGGCNDGFLRKDALLMVTLIGSWDEANSDLYSKGTPEEWAQAVVTAKHGDPKSIVMLDIGDTSFPWQDRIWKLTQMFEYGLVTHALDLDYGPAFEQAADLVGDACAGFVPPN